MKLYLLTASLVMLFHSIAFTQSESISHKQMIYKTIDGHELTADVFYNSTTRNNPNNPAIDFFHGGGWVYGSPDEFFGACDHAES